MMNESKHFSSPGEMWMVAYGTQDMNGLYSLQRLSLLHLEAD